MKKQPPKKKAAAKRTAAKRKANSASLSKAWQRYAKEGLTPRVKSKMLASERRSIARKAAGKRDVYRDGRGKNPRRTRNGPGSDEILAQFEAFHGRPASRLTEREETLLLRDHFAKLGKLLDLEVYVDEDRPILLKPKGVQVVCSGDGGSIYFQGGDQELDLEGLDLAQYLPKDYITVGPVQAIAYHTVKGFHNFEPRDYEHQFGEEGGELPTLTYDTTNKLLFLSGGSYQVRPEGIAN